MTFKHNRSLITKVRYLMEELVNTGKITAKLDICTGVRKIHQKLIVKRRCEVLIESAEVFLSTKASICML